MSSIKIKKRKERKREGKNYTQRKNALKRLKYFLIYALNFNRFSKLMNLTRIYINTDKTWNIKVQFPKKIDRDLSVFLAICTFEWKKWRMIEINKLATGLSQLRFHNNDQHLDQKKFARDMIMLSKISWPSITHVEERWLLEFFY